MSKKNKVHEFDREPVSKEGSNIASWRFIDWLCSKEPILEGENAIKPVEDHDCHAGPEDGCDCADDMYDRQQDHPDHIIV